MSVPVPRTSNANKPALLRSLLFFVTVLYTVLLITRPHEFVPALVETPILQVIVLLAFGVWLMTSEKGTDLPQFVILPFFLMCVWLSLGFAGWWGGIVPALDKLLPPILLFVIVSGAVRSIRELKIYSIAIIACASVLVLHGHLQRTTGMGWTGQPMIQGRITYSGIFNDPNDIGLLIVLSIALCIFHLRTVEVRLGRWAAWAALGWLLYGVYLTDSRGTMLATLAVLGFEAWRSYGKLAMFAAAAAAIPVLMAFTRFAAIDGDDQSASDRVDAWYEGVQLLVDNPVFGVGWGMFSDYNRLTAHNSLVLAMAELGLAGYTLWLGFVAATGWLIWRISFPKAPDPVAAVDVARGASAEPTALTTRRAATRVRASFGDVVHARRVLLATAGTSAAIDGAASAAGDAQRRDATAPESKVERLAAQTLLFAGVGFALGAFFLSQSYKAMLFLNCGLAVGRYLGMRERGMAVPSPGLHPLAMLVLAVGSVVGMWLLVRILL
jgi:hypothetical protein